MIFHLMISQNSLPVLTCQVQMHGPSRVILFHVSVGTHPVLWRAKHIAMSFVRSVILEVESSRFLRVRDIRRASQEESPLGRKAGKAGMQTRRDPFLHVLQVTSPHLCPVSEKR